MPAEVLDDIAAAVAAAASDATATVRAAASRAAGSLAAQPTLVAAQNLQSPGKPSVTHLCQTVRQSDRQFAVCV